MEPAKKIYFPGLNGLRFIAAMLVLVSHAEEIKGLFQVRSGAEGPLRIYTLFGDLAVTFFFVLSGFLITYLLLAERKLTGKISLKKFYLRRIFRIFPLYYLIVLSGFFLLPNFDALYIPVWSEKMFDNFWPKALLYLTFFSNLAAASIYPIPYVSPTWSIGVEEQFYFFWPILMKLFKNSLMVMVGVIAGYLLLAKGMALLVGQGMLSGRQWEIVASFLSLTRMDCMAIGGVAAYFYDRRHPILRMLVYHRFFQILLYAALVPMTVLGMEIGLLTHEVYALLFACVILNVATNPDSLLRLEHPYLRYLGNISYGLYMYHFLSIRLALLLTLRFFGEARPLGLVENFALYGLSMTFTIGLAAISYETFEQYFLNLKKKLAVVESGG
ncbi:MAG: acyltransferase [Saprospiraceae bacterium]|nr:acyltransferase [Saprospiraceae bacterium]